MKFLKSFRIPFMAFTIMLCLLNSPINLSAKENDAPFSKTELTDVKSVSELPQVVKTNSMYDGTINTLSVTSFQLEPAKQNGKFNLKFKLSKVSKKTFIRMVDAKGYEVFYQAYKQKRDAYDLSMDFTHLERGIYYIQILSKDKVYLKKLILS